MDSPGCGGESNCLEERRQIENWEENLVDRELEGKGGNKGNTRGKRGINLRKNRGAEKGEKRNERGDLGEGGIDNPGRR